ncbi:hypothetical protein D3C71_2251670 [compost metagenome]
MHGVSHLLGERLVIAVDGDGGGQAQGDFLGEGRTGDDGQRHVRAQHFTCYFMQETA